MGYPKMDGLEGKIPMIGIPIMNSLLYQYSSYMFTAGFEKRNETSSKTQNAGFSWKLTTIPYEKWGSVWSYLEIGWHRRPTAGRCLSWQARDVPWKDQKGGCRGPWSTRQGDDAAGNGLEDMVIFLRNLVVNNLQGWRYVRPYSCNTMYIYMYVYILIILYVYININIYIYIHTYIFIYIYICIWIYN